MPFQCMPHVLCRLMHVDFDVVAKLLREHASLHAKDGLYLEHVWRTVDVPNEVQFLFRADDLEHARASIEQNHQQARAENPKANLPIVTYLDT